MANTPKWNSRLKHEWLAHPKKKKHTKRSQAARIGLADALDRKAAKAKAAAERAAAKKG